MKSYVPVQSSALFFKIPVKFIKKQKLKPDYSFYISNQIMKPVTQIFSLILESMEMFSKTKLKQKYDYDVRVIRSKYKGDDAKTVEKIQKLRDSIVKKIIFDESLRNASNTKKGQRTITSFFG